MRPVRFVALSEDGADLILTDDVGRMLSLPINDALVQAVQKEQTTSSQLSIEVEASLTPRDIQARIRSGDSVAEVARVANVPVEKVLRFAGPVLQERAAMVQLSRRTRLKSSDNGGTLGDVADSRLREHNVDPDNVAWDAYRRENGAWRIVAAWQSGKGTSKAIWDLDKARSIVTPMDEMASFLTNDQQTLLALDEPPPTNRQKIATTRIFTDDEDAEHREGPVVPALSVLRRERGEDATTTHLLPASPVSPNSLTRTAPGVSQPPALPQVFGPPRPANPINVPSAEPLRPEPSRPVEVAPVRAEEPRRRTAPSILDLPQDEPVAAGVRKADLPSWDDILFGGSG